MVRCKACNRRLLPSEILCIGGEHVAWELPPHKTKDKIIKRAKGDKGRRL